MYCIVDTADNKKLLPAILLSRPVTKGYKELTTSSTESEKKKSGETTLSLSPSLFSRAKKVRNPRVGLW
jgi:hypothetical protein